LPGRTSSTAGKWPLTVVRGPGSAAITTVETRGVRGALGARGFGLAAERSVRLATLLSPSCFRRPYTAFAQVLIPGEWPCFRDVEGVEPPYPAVPLSDRLRARPKEGGHRSLTVRIKSVGSQRRDGSASPFSLSVQSSGRT
jgi:hypothetical protein